jgi:hypothetical protein
MVVAGVVVTVARAGSVAQGVVPGAVVALAADLGLAA